MRNSPKKWWSLCTYATLTLGVTALSSAITAKFNLTSHIDMLKPVTLLVFTGVFPLFFIFITNSIKDSNNEAKAEEQPPSLRSLIEHFTRPLVILKKIKKTHSFASFILFASSIYLLYPFSATHWSTGEIFLREHAIGFSAMASMFYAVMLPYFSTKSLNANPTNANL